MKRFSLLVNAQDITARISPEIYGHFSEHLGRCIYQGIYVGEDSPIPNTAGIRNDVVAAFKEINMPVLRWPGGCFADEYHWKDGIGPKSQRKHMINTNWGGVTEDNSFGTHEFMELCRQVGCEPYITGNVGSGTVREMSEWIEYMTFDGVSPMADLRRENGQEAPWKLKYFGVGNENWGCGGNMTAAEYSHVYRRYQSFCKNYPGNTLYKIACGANSGDLEWTETLMKTVRPDQMQGISLHYYAIPDWNKKGLAAEFDEDGYYTQLAAALYIGTLLDRHGEIMNRYDPECKIGLVVDEWGNWFDVEPGTNPGFLYQQNTMRDAIVAAITLNLFNRHSRRVVMANLAQTVNVLQAVLLTEGAELVKTPTFHVFDLFKAHQSADAVYCFSENELLAGEKKIPMLSSSASVKNGVLTMTLANCSMTEDAEVACDISRFDVSEASARLLTAPARAFNDFGKADTVVPKAHSVSLNGNSVTVSLPACSVAEITLK